MNLTVPGAPPNEHLEGVLRWYVLEQAAKAENVPFYCDPNFAMILASPFES
jgi:hypothetical protein